MALLYQGGGALSLLHTTKLRSAPQADRESNIKREKADHFIYMVYFSAGGCDYIVSFSKLFHRRSPALPLLLSRTACSRHSTFS